MSVRLSLLSIAALSFAACNNGSGGDVALRIQAEMAGARCATGGVAVQTGFDKNSNQVLDDDEVSAEQTKYVCNGAPGTGGMTGPAGETGDAGTPGTPGLNALSVVTAEAAGANCTYGGVRIDVGLDANADGTLGTAEITSTRYVCDRASVDSVYFGDLTIRTAADLALLDGIKVVAGTLTIESLPGGVITFPTLEVVSNQLVFASRDGGQGVPGEDITSATFPELRRAGELNARFNLALTSVAAPKLERLNRLDFSYVDALTNLSVPRLASVGDLFITSNAALTTLDFPALTSAHSLQVSSHALLAVFTAPVLASVTSYLNISGNTVLPVCAAWRVVKGLTSAPGSVYVGGNDETPSCPAADICTTTMVAGIAKPLARCVRPLSYAVAEGVCGSMGTGASLAWVTSDAEWIALSTAVSTRAFPAQGWIGYSDAIAEGTWIVVGGFMGYLPTSRTDFWSPGEPSDTSSSENQVELYASGLANDAPAATELTFICRLP